MCKRCRCNHKLNKCPKDVYVKFVSTSAPFTHVWTPSLWVHRHRLHMYELLKRTVYYLQFFHVNLFPILIIKLISGLLSIGHYRSFPSASANIVYTGYAKVHRVMNGSKTNGWQCSCSIKRYENDIN